MSRTTPRFRRALCGLAFSALAAVGSFALASRAHAAAVTADAVAPHGARAENETYVAEMKLVGAAKAGQEATLEVTLAPKAGYHVNKQYPYKLKMGEVAGVSFPKPVLQRADGAFDDARGSFRVPFVAAKPGKYVVSASFQLSVCSDANCMMDRAALDLAVDVK